MSVPSDPAAAEAGREGTATERASDLGKRVSSALVLAALALAAAWIGGVTFGLFWTIAALLVLREWIAILGVTLRAWPAWVLGGLGIAGAGVLAEQSGLARAQPWLVVILAACAAAAVVGQRRAGVGLGVLYAAVIAMVPPALRGDPGHGLVAIAWLFAVVWLTDIGAYFVGRTLGGAKLWPRLSPKKTWSGFIGGVAIGAAGAWLVAQALAAALGQSWFGGVALAVLSLVAAVLSQGGDLLESALKRRFDVKDSSHLIPGHGGVMDRLDSFWAVCMLMVAMILLSGTHAP